MEDGPPPPPGRRRSQREEIDERRSIRRSDGLKGVELSGTPAFRKAVANQFLGHRVIVEAANGHRFEGTLTAFDLQSRTVLLHRVEELQGGGEFLDALVPAVRWFVSLQDTSND